MHFFEFDTLEQELEKLPVFHRVAFAAACCERILPNYNALCQMYDWGDPSVLRNALDEVWHILQGKPIDELRIERLINNCGSDNIAPDSLDFGSDSYKSLQVIDAICTTLRACNEAATKEIVRVVKYARNTVEFSVAWEDESFNISWEKDGEDKFIEAIVSHPFAVREMAKEAEDLQKLKETETLDKDFLAWLRTSFNNDGKSSIDIG
ncbi:DUF416 family protein [Microcoleus sp. AT9_B5]